MKVYNLIYRCEGCQQLFVNDCACADVRLNLCDNCSERKTQEMPVYHCPRAPLPEFVEVAQ